MRADARRNYERLLDAARVAFREHGADAPLDDIARKAGVGPGTLYRHFPNRDALIAAVYRDDVEELCALAYELLEAGPPEQALAGWMRAQLRHVQQKRGLGAAMLASFGYDSELFAWCRDRLYEASGALLDAARAAGTVRADVRPPDLLRLGHGIAVAAERVPEDADRLLGVVLDGLRATG
ncbi:MAG TPA: helix-turn-helix domain-containing protein [Rugosimonospora sp.]|nr:helix-turn-helix domain-containing protein [Rugosimonospora sp.]